MFCIAYECLQVLIMNKVTFSHAPEKFQLWLSINPPLPSITSISHYSQSLHSVITMNQSLQSVNQSPISRSMLQLVSRFNKSTNKSIYVASSISTDLCYVLSFKTVNILCVIPLFYFPLCYILIYKSFHEIAEQALGL